MRVYADIDKNRATIIGETLSRRLAKFLGDSAIGGVFRARRQDFSFSRDGVPVARIADLSPDSDQTLVDLSNHPLLLPLLPSLPRSPLQSPPP